METVHGPVPITRLLRLLQEQITMAIIIIISQVVLLHLLLETLPFETTLVLLLLRQTRNKLEIIAIIIILLLRIPIVVVLLAKEKEEANQQTNNNIIHYPIKTTNQIIKIVVDIRISLLRLSILKKRSQDSLESLWIERKEKAKRRRRMMNRVGHRRDLPSI